MRLVTVVGTTGVGGPADFVWRQRHPVAHGVGKFDERGWEFSVSAVNLEKCHHQLKSVQDVGPVTLNSPARIEALFACQFIALLCCCLIERELRLAMLRERIAELPLYHEDRPCTAPTADDVLDHLANIQRHHLICDGQMVQTFESQLTPLQAQLLGLLHVPQDAGSGSG